MKKPISSWVVILLMIFLGMTSIAQARTGKTSKDSSSSSSSSSRSTTSKPSKTTSSTDSAFSNAAKTRQATIAWQERNKPTPSPVIPAPVQPNTPVVSPSDRTTQAQLDAIKKQIADTKRQQQIIAAAQTAAQIALTNRTRTPVTTVTTKPTTTTTPVPVATTSSTAVASTTPASDDKGGTSWFTILLVVGGIVWLVIWLRKRATPTTIYRL